MNSLKQSCATRIRSYLNEMHPAYRGDFLQVLARAEKMSLRSLEGWATLAGSYSKRPYLEGDALTVAGEQAQHDLMGPANAGTPCKVILRNGLPCTAPAEPASGMCAKHRAVKDAQSKRRA